MRIVADRNIPLLDEALRPIGAVERLPSAEITAERVRDAELLFVRSTVKVGPALLDGSKVRFVATATIGTDHMDVPWLEARGIKWTSAPGSNADSVVQWFAAALMTAEERGLLSLDDVRLGIVGVGNVGSRVEKFANAMGWRILRCDPPRQRREGGGFVALPTILGECNFVTMHVPLVRDGEDRTLDLLARAPDDGWLINASRGDVVVPSVISERALLDVFAGEPEPAATTAAIATPHVAGHSIEGKHNGTKMVYDAACAFLGVTPGWSPPKPTGAPIRLRVEGRRDEALLLEAIRAVYRIERDDTALREILAQPTGGARGTAFRKYRESYPERHELTGRAVVLSTQRRRVERALRALGAEVSVGNR
jgi:erythronate-4-phosphate dehydrogenase